jgi:hypothetical protein
MVRLREAPWRRPLSTARTLGAIGAVLLVVAMAEAQGIRISEERIPAEPRRTATLTIEFDLATTPRQPGVVDDRDPTFEVTVSSGVVEPSRFTVERNAEGGRRARKTVLVTYTAADRPEPGEVLVSVEGSQGIRLLGQATADVVFRAQGRLFLTPVKGSGVPARPPTQPPGSPTASALNPTVEALQRAAAMAALTGALVGVYISVSRRRPAAQSASRPGRTTAASPPPPRTPPPPPPPKTPPTASPPPPKTPPRAHVRVDAQRAVDVILQATPTVVRGDGASTVHLDVTVIPAAALSGAGLGYHNVRVAYGASRPGYVIDGSAEAATVQAAWEWTGDAEHPEYVEVEFTATVDLDLTLTSGTFLSGGATAPVRKEARCRVNVRAANPAFVVEVPDPVVKATGACDPGDYEPREPYETLHACHHHVEVMATLELFGEVASTEVVGITDIVGSLDGTRCGQRVQALPGPTARARWRPPFLIQEPGHGELATLRVSCDWVGGELRTRAPAPLPTFPPHECEVTVRGCHARFRATTGAFPPRRGTPLLAAAQLLDADGTTPVFDLAGGRAHDDPKAHIVCEVRDLSQGQPTWPEPHRCKIPPRSLVDDGELGSGTDGGRADGAIAEPSNGGAISPGARTADVKARVDAALSRGELVARLGSDGDRPTIRVEAWGRLFTAGRDDLLLWEYQPRKDWEPIHDGPVVYRLIIDDGFGGRAELIDHSRVVLGSLVFETGGPDFRIYEANPHVFELQYVPVAGGELEPGQEVQVRWEFSVVNHAGEPRCPAGSVERRGTLVSPNGMLRLFVGHTPYAETYRYYVDARGDIRRVRSPLGWSQDREVSRHNEMLTSGWQWIDVGETQDSLGLRRRWHELLILEDLPEGETSETALAWLPVGAAEDRGARSGLERIEEWRDTYLLLSARVEMRDGDGTLIAVSDRLGVGVGRTVPEDVWRDHRFRYVLLKLRLQLHDSWGRPFQHRRYVLKVSGDVDEEGDTGTLGHVECLVPADAEDAELFLLPASGSAAPGGTPVRVFRLKLGALDRANEVSGQQARLNNLGLFSGATADGWPDDGLRRAFQRFQEFYDLDPTGVADEKTRSKLEAIHDYYGMQDAAGDGAGPPAGAP